MLTLVGEITCCRENIILINEFCAKPEKSVAFRVR